MLVAIIDFAVAFIFSWIMFFKAPSFGSWETVFHVIDLICILVAGLGIYLGVRSIKNYEKGKGITAIIFSGAAIACSIETSLAIIYIDTLMELFL